MITWNNPQQFTKTTIETHPVLLPFLGGRVEVVHVDNIGERMDRPHIVLYAEAVDCNWKIVLQGDAGTQADAGLLPQNIRGMGKDFFLTFADGRRFELLTNKREPITDAARVARELQLERIKRPERDAAQIEQIKQATKKPLTKAQLAGRSKGGKGKKLFTADDKQEIVTIFKRMTPHKSASWRYEQTVKIATEDGIVRRDGKPLTKRNVQSIIEPVSTKKPKSVHKL